MSFLHMEIRHYLCLNVGGRAKLPNGQDVGPYPGVSASGQILYPYYRAGPKTEAGKISIGERAVTGLPWRR